MKPSAPLEPGVLRTFRLFSGLRLGVLILAGLLLPLMGRGDPMPSPAYWFSLVEVLLLVVYLSWPGLEKAMKGFYLPVGIVWATVGPVLGLQLTYLLTGINLSEFSLILSAWQLIPVLFIPLVVVSWQYRFRTVILFVVLSALFELAPLIGSHVLVDGVRMPYPVIGVVMIRTMTFLVVGNMIANMMKNQRQQRHELTQANHRLRQYAATLEHLTVSRERNRLARELHDVLAHTLSGVAVELEAVKSLWQIDPPRAQEMLDHSLQSTRDGLTETRRALQELRATPLEDLGLPLAIRGLAESMAARMGARLELEVQEGLEYPPEVEQCVYRVAQEALANAAAHAGAGCVRVALAAQGGALRLTIADDGRGFNPTEIERLTRFGLQGMRERVEMIGGQITIESQPGQGTRVQMTYGGAP